MRFRRQFLVFIALSLAGCGQATPPSVQKTFNVAFVISDNFNMIDFAGPWEVFQDSAWPPPPGMSMHDSQSMFNLYTVSEKRDPVTTTGGAVVVPKYTFADAPRPDIVVVGAQRGTSTAFFEWLKKQSGDQALVMSVCTGAAKLAQAGLLDGRPATSHHEYIEGFKERFPKVHWKTSQRFVQSAEMIYTAGGLTSGIDLALHIVAQKGGKVAAENTARYMEYNSELWR